MVILFFNKKLKQEYDSIMNVVSLILKELGRGDHFRVVIFEASASYQFEYKMERGNLE